MASLVAMEISNDLEIHPNVVQRVLDSLDKTPVKGLVEHGVFRMSLFTANLGTRRARAIGEKR